MLKSPLFLVPKLKRKSLKIRKIIKRRFMNKLKDISKKNILKLEKIHNFNKTDNKFS